MFPEKGVSSSGAVGPVVLGELLGARVGVGVGGGNGAAVGAGVGVQNPKSVFSMSKSEDPVLLPRH